MTRRMCLSIPEWLHERYIKHIEGNKSSVICGVLFKHFQNEEKKAIEEIQKDEQLRTTNQT